MKITKILVAGLASTCMTVSAMAEVSQPIVVAPTTDAIVFDNRLNNADLNYAFGGSQDLQVQAMTAQEMDETQGAALPLAYMGGAAFAGGLFNAASYANSVPRNQRTFRGYATAIGTGVVGGAVGASPIGAIRAPIIGFSIILGGDRTAKNMR